MRKQREVLRKEDLVNGALVRSTSTGRVYQLGPPKKRNVNLNVVNHCQLYAPRSRTLAINTWQNLSNLKANGFKYYGPGKPWPEPILSPAPAG